MVKDQWMASAMADDALVVQLLLRLKQSQASDLLIPLTWGLRQPRSRSFPSLRCAAFSNLESAGCSPSTPLSWTGLHSSSPTSDDASDDSAQPPNFSPRSKDTTTNASAAGNYPTIKSSRKRKTLEELKREGPFSDDRVHLGKKSVALLGSFKEDRADNENLKRMKQLSLNMQSPSDFSSILAERQETGEPKERVGPCSMGHSLAARDEHHDDDDDDDDDRRLHVYEEGKGDCGDFLLPDLNMMPCGMEKYERV